jgi:hypothetical protein
MKVEIEMVATAQSSIPSIEDFEAEARSPRGWVKGFIAALVPNEVTRVPYNKKSTAIMLKQTAAAEGKTIQTLERDGVLYALLRAPVEAQAPKPSANRGRVTQMPTPSV